VGTKKKVIIDGNLFFIFYRMSFFVYSFDHKNLSPPKSTTTITIIYLSLFYNYFLMQFSAMQKIYILVILYCCFLGSGCRKDKTSDQPTAVSQLSAPIQEAKFYQLIPGYTDADKFEASGVKYANENFYVIFDNMPKIATINPSLSVGSSSHTLSAGTLTNSNFEAITYDNNGTTHFFISDENELHGSVYSPKILQYDASFGSLNSQWAPYDFPETDKNKGFDGLTWLQRSGNDYMLSLCEGSGKIIVMKKNGAVWSFLTSFMMPSNTGMTDFSDIDITTSGRVAVTSQESSKLWIGQIQPTAWAFADTGVVYNFPTGDDNGNIGKGTNILYGNVEGVSFITETQIVICSDKMSNSQPSYQQFKEQTISIFNLPK